MTAEPPRPEEFLADAAKRAPGDEVTITVRDLIGHWGYAARSYHAVAEVMTALTAAGLTTDPGIEDAGARQTVRIIPLPEAAEPTRPAEATTGPAEPTGSAEPSGSAERTEAEPENVDAGVEDTPVQVSLRVRDLPSVGKDVLSVGPGDTVTDAATLMMSHGYSQLAVTDGDLLRGAVTWESIAAARARGDGEDLRACLQDSPEVVRADDELLAQVPRIRSAGFAFVHDGNRRLVGIVTTADLTDQFANLAGPFFLISEIERRLRRQVVRICTFEEMKARAANRKRTRSVDDLVFGDYQAIFADAELWPRLHWEIAQRIFVARLAGVRQIRNEVMHFRPEQLDSDKIVALENFAKWLRILDPLP